MRTLEEILKTDLDYICRKADFELGEMAGSGLAFTGAAGFIGYYFCQVIKHWNDHNPGNEIRLLAMDNFMRGVPSWLEALQSDFIKLQKHDVIQSLPDAIGDFQYIVHAASIASPPVYRTYPVETIDANVMGIRHILEHATETDVKSILFFSTSEIYGDPPPEEIPTNEDFRGLVSCTGPRACYDESKRLGETLCVVFARYRDVPVKIARPFNNYGPGLKITDGRVLPDFAQCALKHSDIVMLSDGTPTRTFCYIADAVVGYLKILIRGRNGEPYNIGIDSEETSMRELAEMVARNARELWDYSGQVIFGKSEDDDYLTDNPNRRCPDVTKARTELDYAPEITVDAGVRRALEWYYHNQEAPPEPGPQQ
ncbi:MAG: NAD-dependent epimerase/dehydratase family protein [Xanthomonadales bacterium]|nr:NAD-dependent epimerase/dehydratase family protein [Xanthomonadales bacterium]